MPELRERFRILVAEDNSVNQEVAQVINCANWATRPRWLEAAPRPSQALAAKQYPLVLMDCMMPGWTVSRRPPNCAGAKLGSRRGTRS